MKNHLPLSPAAAISHTVHCLAMSDSLQDLSQQCAAVAMKQRFSMRLLVPLRAWTVQRPVTALWQCGSVSWHEQVLCMCFGFLINSSVFLKWVGMTNWKHTQPISNMFMLRILWESVPISSTDTVMESRGSGKASVLWIQSLLDSFKTNIHLVAAADYEGYQYLSQKQAENPKLPSELLLSESAVLLGSAAKSCCCVYGDLQFGGVTTI